MIIYFPNSIEKHNARSLEEFPDTLLKPVETVNVVETAWTFYIFLVGVFEENPNSYSG